MEKKNYQKKNTNNRLFRNNKPQTENKERRYSKPKFRKDTMDAASGEVRQNGAKRTEERPTPQKTYAPIPTKFQFEGKPTTVYHATLATPTVQRYGYSVIPKGQLVRAEWFGNGWCRVTAQDGRQGIVYSRNSLKKLQFS